MCAWILFPTQPTPSILATCACHMITSRNFLDSRFTLRAVADISVARCPPIKLSVYQRITLSRVPCLSALETHLIATLTINTIGFSFHNKSVTVRSCTPFEIRVCTHINVFLKLKVLFKDLLGPKLSNILSCILSSAAGISTFNFINFSISNVECYIVCHTIQAETMRAYGNAMKIFFTIVFIAYITSSSTLCHRLDLSFSKPILYLSSFQLWIRVPIK